MKTNTATIERRPVLSYFALTFAISWGGFLLVGGPSFFAGTNWQTDPTFQLALAALLVGPPAASILLTWLVDGRAGLRELLGRLLKWRVGARWYVVALLTAPLVMTAVLLALSLGSPAFLPGVLTASNKTSALLAGIGVGLVGGFVEELGWTGFAIPRLRRHYGVLATGFIVGAPWAAWHLLQGTWVGRTSSGAVPPALFISVGFFCTYLLPYRMLMVWVYDRTESLLVATLMHASLITSSISGFGLVPAEISGVGFLTMFVVFTMALWLVVGAVGVVNHGHLSRAPLRTPVAP
jgi:membrane protease YdiL (CAAX protease family)